MNVAYPFQLKKYQDLRIFYVTSTIQNVKSKKSPKLAKNVSFFFKFSLDIVFWKIVNSAKIIQWLSFLHIFWIQLRARSLKVSNH